MQMSVYAGSERFTTRHPEVTTHHSFSFGDHYDPDNVAFGPLLAHNDHHLSWGAGFPEHPHSDVELVTWVLRGQLVHTDSLGHRSVVPAGSVQVQSAGSGIRHSEYADTGAQPTRFVQSWLRPDELGAPPARFVATGLTAPGTPTPGLVAVAGDGAQVPVGTAGATLWVGHLSAGGRHPLPAAPRHHLFVATGALRLLVPGEPEATALAAGDAVRLVDAPDPGVELATDGAAEVICWTLPA